MSDCWTYIKPRVNHNLPIQTSLSSLTHRVEISKVLIHLRVAEDGVAFTHSPQHALEGLHLHPLDEARHEPTARRGRIRFEGSFPNLDTLNVLLHGGKCHVFAAHPSLAPSLCMPVHPVTESVSIVGNSSYWGPRASC